MKNGQTQTSRSIAVNVFYGFTTWVLPLALSFIATPIIVKALGESDYGIYALVLGFIGYSFTFSIGRAITKYIAEYRATGETEKIRDVVSATFFINVAIGLFGVISIFLSSRWFVENVFKIDETEQNKTVTALILAAIIVFFTMLNQVFSAVLQGIHRFDVYSKIFNASSFALLCGNLIFARFGFGLLSLLVWNLFVICATCFVYTIFAKKLLPEFGISFSFDRRMLGMVLKYSSGVIGYQVLANLLLLFERGWIIRKLGAESLTYYVVPMTLALYIHGFISSILLVLFPLASEFKEDKPKLLRLYTKATKIVCLLVVFMGTTLIIESERFLKIYLGNDFAERSSQLLIIHTITFGLAAISTVAWQMVEGLGYPNYNFAVTAICVAIGLTLMIMLMPVYQDYGIALARLAGFSIIFLSIYYVENWIFGRVQVLFWTYLIGKLAVAALICGIIEKVLLRNLSENWFSLIFAIGIGGIAYCFVLWLTNYITLDEKLLLRRVLNK
ncbi:MAG TPA: oligosaccharide flippase family protein [Pyrinomonadaceae bacterium]|jgi:O-antigen/teichoic acid export membrane protein